MVITYQEKPFFSNDSHNLALYLKNKCDISENISLFLITTLNKALKPLYTWGDSISKKKIQNNYILVPVTKAGTPDYELMNTYINAQKKLAIKSLVEWKDKIINTTKDIVRK